MNSSDYPKIIIAILLILGLLAGLGYLIFWLVQKFKDTNLDTVRSLRDLAFTIQGKNPNVTNDIILKLGENKYNFTLSNSLTNFSPDHGRLYYDIDSDNLIFLVSSNSFKIQTPATWNISYTYGSNNVNYNIYFQNYSSKVSLKDGPNDVEIQHYLIK